MPLKMTIEPQEWLMIGTTRVQNIHPEQAKFSIEGAAPVLRQAHTITSVEATTPAKRTYLAIQRLYLGYSNDLSEYRMAAEELILEVPSARETVMKANIKLAKGATYGALRDLRSISL
jgi:flagellar biosynthesis repressor protein FlbT